MGPVGQCTMGLVVMVIVWTGLPCVCGRWSVGRGLTALRPFFDFRDLGVHLNGPLASDSICMVRWVAGAGRRW